MDLEHIERHAIMLKIYGTKGYMSVVDHHHLSYIQMNNFRSYNYLPCMNEHLLEDKSCGVVRAVLAKVHKYVCEYANLNYFQLLLQRNNFWKSPT